MDNTEVNKKVYNFLILGETGVGKSTFINAFVNYVNFPTLNDALQAEKIHALIPSKFTITDADFNSKEIKFGEDTNESFAVGQSSTQQCKSYKFEFDDMVIRLIDTPGVGDTRGIKKDEENFDNLLNFLGEFKDISAIVIMLKPNESRVTVLFEYCIKQLLSSLERSAVDNIMFLFTNSRGTFYRPGDTVGPLKAVLKQIEDTPPNVKVPFEKKNMFCLDNEAFRFLLAKREGYDFDEDAELSFKQSWDKSVSVCKTLIKYVTGLKPHRIQNTVSVMEARRTIHRLSKPLAEIAELIQNNIDRMTRLEGELSDTNKTIEELAKYLYVPRIDLKVEYLNYPMTVCATTECTTKHNVEDSTQVEYKTICHGRCYLNGVPKNEIGDYRLQNCVAMTYKNKIATCRYCSHTFLQHMHIYYKTTPIEKTEKDVKVDEKITTKKVQMEDIQKQLLKYRTEREDYEKERDVIQHSVAKFAHFLSNSVILPFNDAYREYIQYLIEKERKLGPQAKQNVIQNFEKLLVSYEEQKQALTKALQNVKKQDPSVLTMVSAHEVMNLIKELYNLKKTGKTIKEMYDAQQRHIGAEIVKQNERKVEFISLKGAAKTGKSVADWFFSSLWEKSTKPKTTTTTTSRTITTSSGTGTITSGSNPIPLPN